MAEAEGLSPAGGGRHVLELSHAVPAPSRSRRLPPGLRRGAAIFAWLLPSLLLVGGFIVYPAVLMVITSLSHQNFTGSLTGWAGGANYRRVLADPVLVTVFWHTVIWTVAVVGITIVLSLGVALILDAAWPGRKLVRALLVVPWATSLVITSLVFRWMLDSDFGAINVFLQRLHVVSAPVRFLAGPSTSFPALIGVGIFVSIPFTTYILLAGLQAIPHDVYEAASSDGASWSRRFRYITLPMLAPFISVAVVMNTIYVFNSFPIIWIITGGGPANETDTLVTYLYQQAFVADDVTAAAATSTLGFAFLALLGLVYWLAFQRRRWAS